MPTIQKPLLIACDFDGTITRNDTLVRILDQYGSPSWRKIQDKVVDGSVSIREGLQSEMNSVKASPEQLIKVLTEQIDLDPSFQPFFRRMRAQGIPVVVLTGGFDLCVETVMTRAGLWPVPYLANRLFLNKGTWQVEFPYPSISCSDCGHCKGDPIRTWTEQGYTTVFAGNGVTDRCGALAAQLTFAKDELKTWCAGNGVTAVSFQSFDDIHQELENRQWL